MGWGKNAGAAPQPKDFFQALDARPIRTQAEPEAAPSAQPAPPVEKPTDAAKAELQWAQFRSRKGWVPETVSTVLYEFIRSRGLFAELTAFAKGRK